MLKEYFMKDQILAIDLGTQSARALIFNPQGDLLYKSQVHIEPYFSDKPGWAEQHVTVFWEAVCEACQKLWMMDGVNKDALAGVTLTTQRGTVINLDAQGNPLRPAISWLDQRRVDDLKPIGGMWGLLFKLLRIQGTVEYARQEAECNWLNRHQPDIMRKTHKYLLLSGYLTYRLTGQFVDSVGAQVGYVPFEYKNLDWYPPGHWKWQLFPPLTQDMMPDLVHPGTPLGEITPQAAAETGIPAGLKLIAAAGDKACEILGSGCIQSYQGALSYGTTATINTTHPRYLEVIPLVPAYPAALPQHYSFEIQIYRGYWMVSWFKKEFGHHEVRVAAERGIAPEALFDELVNQVPPGSNGLVLQPYWTPGVRVPGPEARGAIIGFSDVHTRAHIYRAILEGVAYALREATERSNKRTGIPITELRVSGGGSQSDAAMQLTADIFNLPASRPHTFETSGLGAAIDAAVGLGLHADFESAVAAMVRIKDTFQPNPQTHAIYEGLYQHVYKRMYKQLKGLYQAMHGMGV